MSTLSPLRRVGRVVLVVVLVVVSAACEFPSGSPEVFNSSVQTVWRFEGTALNTVLSPQTGDVGRGWLAAGWLESMDGVVLAEHPELFRGDPVWVITNEILGICVTSTGERDTCDMPFDAVTIHNTSAQRIFIYHDYGDRSGILAILEADQVFQSRRECIEGEFRIRLRGQFLEPSRPGPLCQGDPPWTVTDQDLGG